MPDSPVVFVADRQEGKTTAVVDWFIQSLDSPGDEPVILSATEQTAEDTRKLISDRLTEKDGVRPTLTQLKKWVVSYQSVRSLRGRHVRLGVDDITRFLPPDVFDVDFVTINGRPLNGDR